MDGAESKSIWLFLPAFADELVSREAAELLLSRNVFRIPALKWKLSASGSQ
jgi:hypothetical protein